MLGHVQSQLLHAWPSCAEHVQEMVEELDLDHNGVISFSEFQHYFMNAP